MTNDVIDQEDSQLIAGAILPRGDLISEEPITDDFFKSEFPWTEEASEQLLQIAMLPKNWDCLGGVRPRGEAIRQVEQFFRLLAAEGMRLNKPSINPTPAGGIDLEWEAGSKSFGIEFDGGHAARYLFEDPSSRRSIEDDLFPSDDLHAVLKLLSELQIPTRRR